MENSRNEKAIIMALSFVIGFTAASIYYVNQNRDQNTNRVYGAQVQALDHKQSASAAKPTNPSNEQITGAVANAKIAYDEGVLKVVSGEKETNVTSHYVLNGTSENQLTYSNPNVHKRIVVYSLSPDSNYVYFCAVFDDDTCYHYLFEVDSASTHPITADNEPLQTEFFIAQTASWQGSEMVIGDMKSVSSITPWIVE